MKGTRAVRTKNKSIPVYPVAEDFGSGIAIDRISLGDSHATDKTAASAGEDGKQSHRHEAHSFFILESGSITIEIDFQQYTTTAPSLTYVHPNQVHRTIALKNITVSSLSITNECLHPEYLKLLEGITPAKPLVLTSETFAIIADALALSLKFAERKADRLYKPMLKDSCNALTALFISQYLAGSKQADKLSRFEAVAKAFRQALERNYIRLKSPAAYAQLLHISTPYLNECVKNATGYPVSYHIQQRVVLEAKRLLYHSNKHVKEIAAELGYDDYPYFSRVFTKVAGISALAFRTKNLD